MIPLPPHAKIGPHTVDIFRVEDFQDDPDERQLGQYDFNKSEIRLLRGTIPIVEMSVLFHELAHAWITPLRQVLGDGVEEAVCDMVGGGIAELFLRNPDFIEYLTAQHLAREGDMVNAATQGTDDTDG